MKPAQEETLSSPEQKRGKKKKKNTLQTETVVEIKTENDDIWPRRHHYKVRLGIKVKWGDKCW